MLSTNSLLIRLTADFPGFTFKAGDEFHWSPVNRTITYDDTSDDEAALLHELSHALLGHTSYIRDIGLIELEREAWNYAKTQLKERYRVTITSDQVEDSLDTYRDWLHSRSTCPSCRATGIQIKKKEYKCLVCRAKWRVNDARFCQLRRYKTA